MEGTLVIVGVTGNVGTRIAASMADLRHADPRSYDQVQAKPDLVISVCDRARENLPKFRAQHLHWSEEAFREIAERVDALAPHIA